MTEGFPSVRTRDQMYFSIGFMSLGMMCCGAIRCYHGTLVGVDGEFKLSIGMRDDTSVLHGNSMAKKRATG